MFLGKGVQKLYSKFKGEHSCASVISIKLLCNFIKITLRHECSPVNLLHIFRIPFLKNTSGWPLLILHRLNLRIKTRTEVETCNVSEPMVTIDDLISLITYSVFMLQTKGFLIKMKNDTTVQFQLSSGTHWESFSLKSERWSISTIVPLH